MLQELKDKVWQFVNDKATAGESFTVAGKTFELKDWGDRVEYGRASYTNRKDLANLLDAEIMHQLKTLGNPAAALDHMNEIS